MKKIKGLYNEAIIYTDKVEPGALDQIKEVLDQEWSKGLSIRIMPDVHVGYGVPIGYTQNIKDTVIPNFVGVDIGCGMLVTKLSNDPNFHIDYQKLDDYIRRNIPHGFNVYKDEQPLQLDLNLIKAKADLNRAKRSVGTLGGGNHFIEVNESPSGVYLVIHSGSRHLGKEVSTYWTKKVDPSIGYLKGSNFYDYLSDMKITQQFASLNRKRMAQKIFDFMNWKVLEQFETIHNYIDMEQMILRKGAISAKKGEKVLIPFNMKDGSIIALGLGNKDWNYSAPHGAGRVMGRNEAKKVLRLDLFKREMKGIWTTSVSHKTIDEAPFVYKPLTEILNHTNNTIEVIEHLKVRYNFKA